VGTVVVVVPPASVVVVVSGTVVVVPPAVVVVVSGTVVVVVVPASVVVVVPASVVVVVPGSVVVVVPPSVVVVVVPGSVVVVVGAVVVVVLVDVVPPVVVVVGAVVVVVEVDDDDPPPLAPTEVVARVAAPGVQLTVMVPMWVVSRLMFRFSPRLTFPGVKVTVPAGAVMLPLTVWLMLAPETRGTALDGTVADSGFGVPPSTPMLNWALVAVTELSPRADAPVTRASGSVAVKAKLAANGVPAVAEPGAFGVMSMASWG
jgi:hypothetical protein